MTTPDHYTGRPDGAAHTNNEKFNQLLNRCHHPRAVYEAMWALGSAGEPDKVLAVLAPVARQLSDAGKEAHR